MSTASNARTQLGVIKETVFGTTPSTPVFKAQKHASESLQYSINEVLDESKSLTREYDYTMRGTREVSGTIDGPLDHSNYEALMESAFFNTWTSNVLKLGAARQSLSIEKKTDNGAFFLYKGMVVNTMSISSSASDAAVNVSFDLLGLSETASSDSASGSAYTAATDVLPFTSCGGTLLEGGSPIAAVSAIDLTIDNGINTEYFWGNCDPADLVPGRVSVTGTLQVYFQDLVLYNKFKNGTSTSLSFTLTNGAAAPKTHTYLLSNIRYTGASLPSSSGAESMVISLDFRALYNAGTTGLQVTRSA